MSAAESKIAQPSLWVMGAVNPKSARIYLTSQLSPADEFMAFKVVGMKRVHRLSRKVLYS
jgi:hypothetical protein